MTNLYESDIANDVYDYIFDKLTARNFCSEFPASYINQAHAAIFLGKEDGKELFKITIERL